MSALTLWVAGVLPFLVHVSTGAIVCAGLIAAAVFSPVFKREFVYAAIGVAVGLFVYGVGVHDEAHRRDAKEAVLIQQVRDAVKKAIESGEKDPYDDPRN